MRGHDYPDPIDTPDDDQPTGKRVKCWHCNGFGRTSYGHPDPDRPIGTRCKACGGAGYTYAPETEDTEEAEDEV